MSTLTTVEVVGPGLGQPARSAPGRYLMFTVHGEVYAIDILTITEIVEYRSVTTVPMMPPFVRGVVNLRGRVLPVVDLAARFGQDATQVARRTSILVVEGPALVQEALAAVTPDGSATPADGDASAQVHTLTGVGLMVDSVTKVVQLDDEQIAPPPSFGAGVRAEFISGMARLDGDFAVVLDVGRLLTVPGAS